MEKDIQKKSQVDFIFAYFREHPNEDLTTECVVDWATNEWYLHYGARLKDPDRAIRKLAELGKILKISNGIYKYIPDFLVPPEGRPKHRVSPRNDSAPVRRCAACGLGEATLTSVEKVEIIAGNAATIFLCRQHADMFRYYGVLDFAQEYFRILASNAAQRGDLLMKSFCEKVQLDLTEFSEQFGAK